MSPWARNNIIVCASIAIIWGAPSALFAVAYLLKQMVQP